MLVEIFSLHSCHQQTDQVGPVQVEGRKVDPAGSASWDTTEWSGVVESYTQYYTLQPLLDICQRVYKALSIATALHCNIHFIAPSGQRAQSVFAPILLLLEIRREIVQYFKSAQ